MKQREKQSKERLDLLRDLFQARETEREDEALNSGWLRKRSREDNEKAEDRKDKVNKARRDESGEQKGSVPSLKRTGFTWFEDEIL